MTGTPTSTYGPWVTPRVGSTRWGLAAGSCWYLGLGDGMLGEASAFSAVGGGTLLRRGEADPLAGTTHPLGEGGPPPWTTHPASSTWMTLPVIKVGVLAPHVPWSPAPFAVGAWQPGTHGQLGHADIPSSCLQPPSPCWPSWLWAPASPSSCLASPASSSSGQLGLGEPLSGHQAPLSLWHWGRQSRGIWGPHPPCAPQEADAGEGACQHALEDPLGRAAVWEP